MPVFAANALTSDLVTGARDFLNDPSSGGRWTDTAMIRLANRAMKILNRDILFPQARWDITVVAGQYGYEIAPTNLTTDAVQCNGQLLSGTTKKAIQGQQLGYPSQGSASAITATGIEIPGGATGSVYLPTWVAQGPATYPVPNGGPLGPGSPFYGGAQPQYFWDGGYLVVVPAPQAGTITLWGVPVVPDVQYLTDGTYFPANCVTCLVWKMCEIAKFADDSDRAAEARNYAASQYEKEMRSLRVWNRRRTGDDSKVIVPRTRRSEYVKGNHKAFGFGLGDGDW